MTRRVLFHVQHLLGTGHLRRTAMLARTCAARGLEVTVASGGTSVAGLDLGGAALVQLPALRAADARFTCLVDEHGREIDDRWRERRRALLLDLFARLRPHAVVVETFPFGRRRLAFELLPLLAAARDGRAVTVSSVRDILTARQPRRTAEAAAWARRHIDHVLVHGDPSLVAFDDSFPATTEIADRLIYTGYVAAPPAQAGGPAAPGHGEIVVSSGGGAVGAPLLRAALGAPALARVEGAQRWRLLAGADLDEAAFAALVADAPKGVVVERARPDFPIILSNCAVSVSQGGYNTVVELLLARARAVLVPFARGGETEQALRAGRLAAQGRVLCIDEDSLTPARLAEAVDGALVGPRPGPPAVAMDGAGRSAVLIAAWSEGVLKGMDG